MAAEYDEQGNYKYPEGFDPETNEWLEGFETQREKWEKQYAEAHARWEAHRRRSRRSPRPTPRRAGGSEADVVLLRVGSTAAGRDRRRGQRPASAGSASEGTLASDEALAALREKLTGN